MLKLNLPPDLKNWLTGKDPDAGKDWRQEKGKTEDEMFEWYHRLNGQAQWVSYSMNNSMSLLSE